jgi:hypothetical protein
LIEGFCSGSHGKHDGGAGFPKKLVILPESRREGIGFRFFFQKQMKVVRGAGAVVVVAAMKGRTTECVGGKKKQKQ